jgi:hypothetical protein
VTEAEWLACTDPRPMLEYLRDMASDRQLRLFACAYCRTVRGILHLGPGPAVAVAERYADGLANDEDLASERRGVPFPDMYASWVIAPSAYDGAWQAVDYLTSALDLMKIDPDALRHFPIPADDVVKRSVLLLRDIFGPLLFRPITLDPSCLTWHDGLLVSMARQMFDSRDFTDMPILADALEEAGCTDQDILSHSRSGGEHFRGCWVVDLLLGKE